MRLGPPVIALLLCVLPVGIAAAEETTRPAALLCAIMPARGADASYRAVLLKALEVQVSRNLLRALPVELAEGSDAVTAGRRALAATPSADYLVVGTYTTNGEDLELTLQAWERGSSKAFGQATESGRIGLTLDALVAEALDSLLPLMKRTFPAEGGEAGATPTAGAASGETPATTAASGETPAMTADGDATAIAAGPPVIEQPQALARWRPFDLSVDAGALVTTSDTADYVKLGALSTLAFDVRFPLGSGAIGAGLLTGAAWLHASGVSTVDVVLVPIGLDLRWTMGAGWATVVIQASGGPAVLMAITGSGSALSTLVPYVLGGLEVDLTLSRFLGLRIGAGYAVFVESTIVLQAFVPHFALRLRF